MSKCKILTRKKLFVCCCVCDILAGIKLCLKGKEKVVKDG